MMIRIPNVITVTPITISGGPVFRAIILKKIVRRYPTDCLHTNRQIEALNVMFAGHRVRFWDEVFS
jgi:hypothetical protein